MTKPKVQSLLLFTTVTTMYVAGDPSLWLVAAHLPGRRAVGRRRGRDQPRLDRDLDRMMKRTADRPVASGRVSPAAALWFGIVLGGASFVLLAADGQPARGLLSLSGLLGYVFVYTLWLKRSTPQNIVIGGAAGAVPPLVAWAAVTGGLAGTPLYLFAIVFFWTPPHFWSLSLLMKDEYARAGVPMLPVVRGEARDAPPDPALHGAAYAVIAASVLRGRLRAHLPRRSVGARRGVHLRRLAADAQRDRRRALRLYLYSLAYLALLFAAMVARRAPLAAGGWPRLRVAAEGGALMRAGRGRGSLDE